MYKILHKCITAVRRLLFPVESEITNAQIIGLCSLIFFIFNVLGDPITAILTRNIILPLSLKNNMFKK